MFVLTVVSMPTGGFLYKLAVLDSNDASYGFFYPLVVADNDH